MNVYKLTFSLLVLLSVAGLAQQPAQRSFTAIKSLAGDWNGKSSEGDVRVSFEIVSSGSALMSRLRSDHANMVTMFHLDGDQLLMTHYCDAGNQPRMKAAASPDGKAISFDFLDTTNLQPGQPGHMKRLVIAFQSPDHHTETWVFDANGKDETNVFDLYRSHK